MFKFLVAPAPFPPDRLPDFYFPMLLSRLVNVKVDDFHPSFNGVRVAVADTHSTHAPQHARKQTREQTELLADPPSAF